jgi:hypothetical protein
MRGRSVWAVVAGILFAVILTTLVDFVLHVAGVYPSDGRPLSDGLSALATAYRVVIGVGAAWLTARLAPKEPMRHALVGGAIGAVVALIGVIVTWNRNLGPHWYGIALAVLALPQSWLGARLFELGATRTMEVADAA